MGNGLAKKKKVRPPIEKGTVTSEGTESYWIELWKDFLVGYKKDRQLLVLKATGHQISHPGYYHNLIADMVVNAVPKLEVDYNDLVYWITFNEPKADKLSLLIRDSPDDAIKYLTMAATRLVRKIKPDYVNDNENFVNFHTSIKNYEVKKEIPEIGVTSVGKFVQVEGFVVQQDNRKPYLARAGFQCAKEPSHMTYVTASNFSITRPLGCESCDGRRLIPLPEATTYIDVQRIKVQQRQDRSIPGKIPEPIELIITNPTLIDEVQAGDYCKVTGVIRVLQSNSQNRNAIAIYYMDVNFIERKEDEYFVDVDSELEEHVKRFMDPEDEEGCLEELVLSVAPALYGGYSLKKALLAQCAGSDSQKIGARRFRGELQIGLFGPPGSGKTTAGEWMVQVFPRFMWISPLVTDVGLTASVTTVDGVHRLDAGAYMIASSPLGGLVVADEIQNYDDKSLRVFAGVMDDRQRINISKYGMNADLQVSAGTLAMGNPQGIDGIWDRSLNLSQNTGLPAWFLSRLDLCFIEDDVVEEKMDTAKIRHINEQFSAAIPEYKIRQMQLLGDDIGIRKMQMSKKLNVEGESVYNEIEMRAYISYVRAKFHPELTEEAMKKLETYYIKLRRDHASMQKSMGSTLKKPTTRDYQGLVRLSKAHARLCCRDKVLARDAEWAVTLMMESIESAGFNPLTGQMGNVNNRLIINEVNPYDSKRDSDEELEPDEDERFDSGVLDFKRKRLRQIKRKAMRILLIKGTRTCESCGGRGCIGCSERGINPDIIGEYDIKKLWKDKNIDEVHVKGMWDELLARHFVKPDPRRGIEGYYRLTTDGLRLVVANVDDEIYADFYDIYNDDKVENDINFNDAAKAMQRAARIAEQTDRWKAGVS